MPQWGTLSPSGGAMKKASLCLKIHEHTPKPQQQARKQKKKTKKKKEDKLDSSDKQEFKQRLPIKRPNKSSQHWLYTNLKHFFQSKLSCWSR